MATSIPYGSKPEPSLSSKNKDPTNPTSYRPITLTSCSTCKSLKRMINLRLIWFLEPHNHITNLQTGFRAKRSTIDQIVYIETLIRKAFMKKEHLVAVFFLPCKSLWHIIDIWYTQRSQPTRQTPHLNKAHPRRLDLPSMNKQHILQSQTTKNKCTPW